MDLANRELKDLSLLALFIDCWCAAHHADREREPIDNQPVIAVLGSRGCRLCPECRDLLDYAIARRRHCPLDPRPACKNCPIHCYKPERRALIREIMRFSGRRLIMRGRLHLLWHYFF